VTLAQFNRDRPQNAVLWLERADVVVDGLEQAPQFFRRRPKWRPGACAIFTENYWAQLLHPGSPNVGFVLVHAWPESKGEAVSWIEKKYTGGWKPVF
jgi:hypothetical protein